MNKKIVIALGGNALGKDPKEQLINAQKTAKPIADLIELGYKVVVTHGNGPQVGMIKLAFTEQNKVDIPFPECVAMTQGYIGYHLQNAIKSELLDRNITKEVATIVSQVIVDKDDAAFKNPSKPIGSFYTKEEAKKITDKYAYIMKEDAGRGYRRVVPSPLPIGITEIQTMKILIENDICLIANGGGGIPVIEKNNALLGVEAVIDKDFSSEKLAELIESDQFLILTAVDKVAINFGKDNQENLSKISVDECKKYIAEKHFAEGSMLPKIEAAIKFCESKKGRKVLITSLDNAAKALRGKGGTLIY